jgi:predicted metal-dependent phosphoesterase TrpH
VIARQGPFASSVRVLSTPRRRRTRGCWCNATSARLRRPDAHPRPSRAFDAGAARRPQSRRQRDRAPGRGKPASGGSVQIPERYYFDLHSHSTDASDDAGGTVEGYLKWIVARRKKGYRIDGIVLTEHRQFDRTVDYSDIASQYGVVVLRGAEVETDVGHVLTYGIDERFTNNFDLSNVALPYAEVFEAVYDLGGFAVGAHAGRPRIGLAEHVEQRGVSLAPVRAIEQLNGGSNDEENGRALELAEAHGLHRVGGSDAHFVSAIGRCLTAFAQPIARVEELVEALRGGDYYPVTVEDTLADQAAE